MQASRVSVITVFCLLSSTALAQPLASIPKMEAAGDALGASHQLARAVEANPGSIPALTEYAEFLERYGDPGARDAYANLLAALRHAGDNERAGVIARRLAILDLLAGNSDATSHDLDTYHAVTGKPLTLATSTTAADAWPTANIPGPFRSFARMAAISQDAPPASMLAALARNIVTNGFQASHSNDALVETEYLKLIHRYLSEARELEQLAGPQKVIKVDSCDSPVVPDLLRILGFRMRGGCGSELVLETVNAARAFLTTDSGFPLNKLEEALRTDHPFVYDYHPTAVGVLFGPEYWLGGLKGKESSDFIEAFISDPSLCRLYLGLSKLDPETAAAMRKGVPFARLKAFAHVLDFFGGMFEIRNGQAAVPGGQRSAAAWGDLAGTAPDKGVQFYDKLIARDDGWLASLYDALARIHGPVQDYLTEPARLKRFYTALRGRITTPGPARPVFRSNTDMMLLTSRLRLDRDGKPHIPGSLEVWRNFFVNHPQGKYDGKLTRIAATWKDPDDVLEALFALCRKTVENEPLKIFMALSDLDRKRDVRLQAATVDRLARAYTAFGSQYPAFAESGSLTDKSIGEFLDAAETLNKIHDPLFRADATGSFQSLVGLWQILVRQQSLPDNRADAAFSGIVASFAQIRNDRELFDAGRNGIHLLVSASASTGDADAKQSPQGRLVALLAGMAQTSDAGVQSEMAQQFERVFEAQHIISLDTLFQFADQLDAVGKGGRLNTVLVTKLAGQIAEIQPPRSPLSGNEKTAVGFGYWTDRHIDAERRLNFRSSIQKAAGNAEKLAEIRGDLAPLLRDTLVAFNYAAYAPPGAQILYTNPTFVRTHDFIGIESAARSWRPTEPYGTGWPSNAGGRLVGSLATLPYALAEAEQNFLVPSQTQALIWGDLVPEIVISAKVPRWWSVTPDEMHFAGLHIRYGRELLAESAFDPAVRQQVVDALGVHAAPARTAEVARLLEQGDVKQAAETVTPAELFSIARDLAPKRPASSSCLVGEINRIHESGTTYDQISRAFGTPKPTLANSYQPELLGLRTFPALMGYSSRILAESWESNTLYWAALADEIHLPPAELNVRIPEWTQKLVEQIFASHLEDWPALLKSLLQVGETVRTQNRADNADRKIALGGDR
jgi:hypothetical protein